MNKHFIPTNLERCSLSVARCELNNLADCTSKGLAIGVSHLGGDTRYSVVTIHKTAADNSYGISVMNTRIPWDAETTMHQFKQAIVAARKVICEHNKLIKSGSKVPLIQNAAERPAKGTFTVKIEWSGFSRGYSIYEVEAASELEAKEYYGDGNMIERQVVHDNTKQQSSTIISPASKAA
jgi:hypothetical protein